MTLDRDTCITCGDVGQLGTVVGVEGETATVELEGRQEQVGVELVTPVAIGDVLLCHAGIALTRVEEPA